LLAEDLDDRFFQSAPTDQQAPRFLRGGEAVSLLNLAPGQSRLQFNLPRLYLGFETHFLDHTREIHQLRRLHSVIIEPDFPRVSLVWHSVLRCHAKVHKLDRTVIVMKAAVNAPADEVAESIGSEGP
ncbi:DUF2169 domain-containing protein, partial [Ideonella sp.]|uniref:DUF2169 domain-containing protein n=1 Tax=Ideonella sp. TaxID=1929293 RepID=UPI003BB6C149